MNPYEQVGLKCGLEVHQQLDTGKLFCRCQGILHDEVTEKYIHRFLKPVASELGEFDRAAVEQFARGQSYAYHYFSDCNCLVDLDEEPPHNMDQDALDTVLMVSLMTNSSILDVLHPMRKLVIDGSNVSGFQRTTLVSLNGFIDIPNKKIGVQTIAIEEDSARPVKQEVEKNITHYNLDRLGVPLIELATDASISTPEECKEAARKIGEIFRLTGMARRGLGSIRQDVNISIRGGSRVEIKGCQNLETLDEVVKREITRQQALISLKEELHKRKVSEKELTLTVVDLTKKLENSESKLLKGKTVFGVRVSKLNGLFGMAVQPNRRFGTEIANYVKQRTGLRGLLHSDELPNYGVTTLEVEQVKDFLKVESNDAFVLVIADLNKATQAFGVMKERILAALSGVPEETRQALEDGNSEYLRPLPGSARMYPETDIVPIHVSKDQLKELKQRLPKSVQERKKYYTQELKISPQLADKMVLANEAIWFESLVKRKIDSTMAAVLLLEGLTQLERENVKVEQLSKSQIEEVLLAASSKVIPKEAMLGIIREWSKHPTKTLEEIKAHANVSTMSEKEALSIIQNIVQQNKSVIAQKGDRAFSALMGDAMKELRGKVSGDVIGKLLKLALEENK